MTEILETPKLVTIFGGSGFIGRHVVRALAKRGYRIRVATRRPDLAGHLQPLGNVGQIQPVQANIRVRWSVDRAVEGADHVINLVGILYPVRPPDLQHRPGFRRPRRRRGGARRQGQADPWLGARRRSAIRGPIYARTKARGERAVQETVKDAVIFRPSIVFGPEDRFFNRFAEMARLSPVLPLIGGGHTRFQPVYVGDVAEAIARSVDGNVKGGRIYELGGPQRADLPRVSRGDARSDRPPPAARAGPVVGGAPAGVDPRHAAEPAADHRPGHLARRRTMWSPPMP